MRRPFLPGGLSTKRKARTTNSGAAITPRQRAIERAATNAFVRVLRDACLPLWRITPNFSRAWQVLLMSAVMAVSHIPVATPAQAAGGITAVVSGGVLTVVGTPGDDTITLNDIGGNIKINDNNPDNGAAATSSLTSIVISGGAGDDTIDTSVQRPGTISGGNGRDLLVVYANGEIVLGNGSLAFDSINSSFDTFEQAKLWGPINNGTQIYDAANSPVPVEMVMRSSIAEFTGSLYNDRFVGITGNGVIRDATANDNDTVAYEGSGSASATATMLMWSGGSLNYNGVGINSLSMIGDDSDNYFNASDFPGSARLEGMGGSDTLIGTAYNDFFLPGTGNGNVIADATAGDKDWLIYGEDADITLDQISLRSTGSFTTFNGVDFSHILLSGGHNGSQIDASGFSSRETIVELYGDDGDDELIGADASTLFSPGTGIDTLRKPIDNPQDKDEIQGSTSANLELTPTTLIVGSSVATINGFTLEFATLRGNASANVIDASRWQGDSLITGLEGDDTISGGAGDDTIDGGAGNDLMRVTTTANMTLTASGVVGAGTDIFSNIERLELNGSAGNNRIDASAYGQQLRARTARAAGNTGVVINGLGGDDTITGSGGDDTLDGGPGIDTLVQTVGGVQTLSNTQATGRGTDAISNFERATLTGGSGDDTIDATGFSGDTVINGLAGDDIISGGSGNDVIDGGAGFDTLTGGGGNNTLSNGETVAPPPPPLRKVYIPIVKQS